ncbi:MAG: patatin-like phospholipase family protein [Verrucomicrobia bacterium]|nr:patatin-like phospholipase family protein [Verrucomicrobiota bacterium]
MVAGVSWLAGKVTGKPGKPRKPGNTVLDRILDYFYLKAELGDSYALEQAFVRLFDPDYYGRFSMDKALATALSRHRNEPQAPGSEEVVAGRKTLSIYTDPSRQGPPIHIVPVAANLKTNKLESFRPETSVIDALMASTALVPVFKARVIEGCGGSIGVFCDGANISNEPVREAMRFLQKLAEKGKLVNEDVSEITIYSVTPFPIGEDSGSPAEAGKPNAHASKPKPYTQVVDVVARAAELVKLRDAKLEQKLMSLYNRVLPPGERVWRPSGTKTCFVRANPVPIDIDAPLGINARVFAARSPEERRRLIAAAVADGCRCSLERFIASDPAFHAKTAGRFQESKGVTVCCADVIEAMRTANDLPARVPGASARHGPGIPEVCQACRGPRCKHDHHGVQLRVSQRQQPGTSVGSSAAHERSPGLRDETSEAAAVTETGANVSTNGKATDSPRVALLFGGGVFRGVFQIGVANALRMLLAKPPQIVAGASVGSITGALIAQLLCKPSGEDAAAVQMRRLAATYLALDRLILTDRLADAARRFTIRASDAAVSVRDIDLVLRRFELGDPLKFTDRARRVATGLERLFYLSPFAFFALIRDMRLQRRGSVYRRLKGCLQELLERYGMGIEALGSEPLARLLREHVLRLHKVPNSNKTYADLPEIATFDFFRGFGIELLATVTNLTKARLDVLSSNNQEKQPRLVDGLLASSAFPGVFRPRWSWEVFVTPSKEVAHQFIDGGIFDNLPFHPVVNFIRATQRNGGTPHRVPHLIFTASLEAQPEDWSKLGCKELQSVSQSWTSVRRRAAEMKLNKKIDDFAQTQREIGTILQKRPKGGNPVDSRLVQVEVLAVKPNWLPNTFGFHPMLGFRRETQAASIAHGCYQTMKTLHEFLVGSSDGNAAPKQQGEIGKKAAPEEPKDPNRPPGREEMLMAWEFKVELVSGFTPEAATEKKALFAGEGWCWYNRKLKCPFSEKTGKAWRNSETDELRDNETYKKSLDRIYELCGQKQTHQRRSETASKTGDAATPADRKVAEVPIQLAAHQKAAVLPEGGEIPG